MKSAISESMVSALKQVVRFRDGIVYSLAGAVAGQGASFAVSLILANLLGKQLFGEYSMILSTILTVSLIGQLGTGYAASKYIAELRLVDTIRASRVLGLLAAMSRISAFVAAGMYFIGANALSEKLFQSEDLMVAHWVGSIAVLFSVMNGFAMGTLAGLEAYRAAAIVTGLGGTANVILGASLAFHWGTTGAIAGLALSSMIQWHVSRTAVRRLCVDHGIFPTFRNALLEKHVLTRFALPGALSGLTSMPAMWLANASLAIGPGGFERLAIYSASLSIMRMVGFLPGVINTVGMTLINTYRGANDQAQYKAAFSLNLLTTLVSSTLMAVALGLFAKQVLAIFGAGYDEGITTLLILLAAGVIESAVLALNQVVQSKEKMWFAILAINLPRDGALIALAFSLGPLLGHKGVALAFLLSRVVALGSMLISVRSFGLSLAR